MEQETPGLIKLRRDAMAVFQSALAAVDPEEAVRRHLRIDGETLSLEGRRYDLAACERILVVGAGKAVAPMAKALEEMLGDRIDSGILVVKDGHSLPLKKIRVREASHPVPDERGVAGTLEILKLLEGAGPRDLVLCLISGGGSALLIAPAGESACRTSRPPLAACWPAAPRSTRSTPSASTSRAPRAGSWRARRTRPAC